MTKQRPPQGVMPQEKGKERESLSRRKRFLFRILAVVLPLVLIEAAARLTWFLAFYRPLDEKRFVEDVKWQEDWKEGQVPYVFPNNMSRLSVAEILIETNNLGFRGDEPIDIDGGYSGLRFVCVGDSVTFGYTVPENAHTYPAVVERILRDKGWTCQVVNAGMPRYRVSHMVNLFEGRLPYLNARALVLLGGWNDLFDNVVAGPGERWRPVVDGIERHCYTFRVARALYLRWAPAGPVAERVPARINPMGYEKFKKSVRRLVRYTLSSRVTPVLCTLPSFFRRTESDEARQKAYQFTAYGTLEQLAEATAQMNDCLRAVAAEEGVAVCELTDIDDPALFSDAVHPNAEGSTRIAERVAAVLLRMGTGSGPPKSTN